MTKSGTFPHLSGPEIVCWDVTLYCNQACLSCYNFARQTGAKTVEEAKKVINAMRIKKTDPEPSLKKSKEIIDALAKGGVFEIDFMGGEPMSYPHIGEVVKYAYEKGIISNFITNGTYVDEFLEQINRVRGDESLKEFLNKRLNHVGFSLHGKTAKLHEAFTQLPGSFNVAIKGMKKLGNLRVSVGILFSPFVDTKDCLYDTIKMLVKDNQIKLHTVYLNRLVKVGGCRINQDIMINESDYLDMIDQLVKVREDFGVIVKTTDGVPYCRALSYLYMKHKKELISMPLLKKQKIAQEYLNAIGTCYFGSNNLAINWEGLAKICTIPPDRFNLGNITTKGVKNIWKKLSRYRTPLVWASKCIHNQELCEFYPDCRGACKITHTVNEKESSKNIYSEDYLKVGITAARHLRQFFGLNKNEKINDPKVVVSEKIKPKFKRSVFIRKEGSGYLLYEASREVFRSGVKFRLNHKGKIFVELIDGKKSLENIASKVGGLINAKKMYGMLHQAGVLISR